MIVLRVWESHIQGEAISGIVTGLGIVTPTQQRLEYDARKTKSDSSNQRCCKCYTEEPYAGNSQVRFCWGIIAVKPNRRI
ncbi:MAG: hypothetical protein ACR5KX_02305 [Wolbachia sp.]